MGSYAYLRIDDVEIAWFKNGIDPIVALLFVSNDLRTRRVPEGIDTAHTEYEPDDDGLVSIHELASGAYALRERLNVLGIGPASVERMFGVLLEEKRARKGQTAHHLRDIPEIRQQLNEETEVLRTMTFQSWCDSVRQLRTVMLDGDQRAIGSLPWLVGLWEQTDPRYTLQAMLCALPDAKSVSIDVTDLITGGWLKIDEDPRGVATKYFTDDFATSSSAVILTEGVSDARILSGALSVLKPHLTDFIRFLDFSAHPEGGAPALVRAVKSFAAAGIQNRVVALFDNDTAAENALLSLDAVSLPSNFHVLRLPPLPLAAKYPTIGPTGITEMDVNGLAGSIELYLGEDVLRDEDGQFWPVQWRGYDDRLGRYQGEVTHKQSIHRTFETKLTAALSNREIRAQQDWNGLELILRTIIVTLASGSVDRSAVAITSLSPLPIRVLD